MRPLVDMDTIQIEITNQCHNRCSNCTRLIGHHEKPYFMSFEQFKEAVDSMVDYSKMTGMMGGEPLLHPQFREFCEYMRSRIDPAKLGLWTCLPKGFEHYREDITQTFGNIFLNDHSRPDVLHGPILVSAKEIEGTEHNKWYLIDKCWMQQYWSASINPKGAFFCEVAAALALLIGGEDHKGWKVGPGWYNKIPKDFKEQMEKYCMLCGCAMPLKKRESIDGRDDISPEMIERLKGISPKIKAGKYVKHNLALERDNRQTATYKDCDYRAVIAKSYGMFLVLNPEGFQSPYLISDWKKEDLEDGKNKIAGSIGNC